MQHELRGYNARLQRVLWWSLLAGMISLVVITIFISGPEIERRFFPVSVDWVVTDARTDGRDLIISGQMRKVRNCAYIPGPLSRAKNGQNLFVESKSPTAGASWSAHDEPQKFGPWVVRDGAGRQLTFYQQHDCHLLWPTFTELGKFDARTLEAR